jgi:hypothetical protein
MLQLEAAVAAAQDVLVSARREMIKEKRAAATNKEKVLGEGWSRAVGGRQGRL